MKKAKLMLSGIAVMAIVGGLFAFNTVKNTTPYFKFDNSRPAGDKCFTTIGFTTNVLVADDPSPITTLSLSAAADKNSCVGATTVYIQDL